MPPSPHDSRFVLTVVADTRDVFADFAPYAASVNDRGVVAFQAALRDGRTGLFAGDGGPVATLARGDESAFVSHPDLDDAGAACAYTAGPGGQALVLARDARARTLVATGTRFSRIGPLGPTVNARGAVAFRADTADGRSGVFVWDDGAVVTVADTGRFTAFHGLPVVDGRGRVLFRADTRDGTRGVYRGDGGAPSVVVETGARFVDVGAFPSANDAGTVLFTATRADGASGIYTSRDGEIRTVVETGGDFEAVRGGLVDDAGDVVFYATPRGGELGVYADRGHVLGRGDALLGSTVTDLALNPVSMNGRGRVAVRIALASGLQAIVRATRD